MDAKRNRKINQNEEIKERLGLFPSLFVLMIKIIFVRFTRD